MAASWAKSRLNSSPTEPLRGTKEGRLEEFGELEVILMKVHFNRWGRGEKYIWDRDNSKGTEAGRDLITSTCISEKDLQVLLLESYPNRQLFKIAPIL